MKILKITIKDETVPVWAGVASSVAILAALGSQYLGGLHPGELCLWQRIPHGVIIVLALGALLWFRGKRERTLNGPTHATGGVVFGTTIANVVQFLARPDEPRAAVVRRVRPRCVLVELCAGRSGMRFTRFLRSARCRVLNS